MELVYIWFCCVCCEIRLYFGYALDDEKFRGFFDIKFYNYIYQIYKFLAKNILKIP